MSLQERASREAPYLLGVLRIVLGLLFIEHGSMKLLGFPPSHQFADLKLFSLGGLAGVIELFGGILLLLGLYTRLTAFILSGQMAAAYFIAHATHGFFPGLNMGEPAVAYCFTFLYLASAGGGAWSLDRLFERRDSRLPMVASPSPNQAGRSPARAEEIERKRAA